MTNQDATQHSEWMKNISTPVERDFVIPDFTFTTGEHLDELRLHYTTLGSPEQDDQGRVTNAVMILHGTGGTGKGFFTEHFAGELFCPGQLLDARKYYLVFPDGIGHGGSSKPSNGLKAHFPRYTYADMIRAQHLLLTEGLGVEHLKLIMGTSMGGMHCWMWAETYPNFMDAVMPLASLPAAIAGRNRMMRRMVIDSIRLDPAWKGGDYEVQPKGLTSAVYTLIFMVSVPLAWHKQAPTRDQADDLFDYLVKDYTSKMDANDMLYQFGASRDYDPAPYLEWIETRLTAVNSADDAVNPPELGILEEAVKRVKRGRAVVLPVSERTMGHRTHSYPALWKEHLAELLEER